MSTLERKREEFRKYLESAGAIDNLTKALVALYEQKNKPDDAIKFLRREMCKSCHDEEQYEMLEADLKEANAKICLLEREISRLKGEVKKTVSEMNLALLTGFDAMIAAKDSPILLKKVFRKDYIEQSADLKTIFKGTLLDCVQSGMTVVTSPVGAFACDPDAYNVFNFLFNPLIETLHFFRKSDNQPDSDWGEPCKLPELDPNYVKTIRVSCRRNVKDFPFGPIMNFDQYEQVMDKLACAAKCLCGSDLRGKLYPFEGMSDQDRKMFIQNGLMFTNEDECLQAANILRFWPTGRAIFINDSMTFSILCNQQDHFKFIGIDFNGNLRNAYEILMSGVTQVSKDIPMAQDERLGFVTCSPVNLGNTIRVSVRMELEKLPLKKDKLDEMLKKHKMTIRKCSIEESGDFENLHELSSNRCMGVTEFQTVNEVGEAIIELIEAEKEL